MAVTQQISDHFAFFFCMACGRRVQKELDVVGLMGLLLSAAIWGDYLLLEVILVGRFAFFLSVRGC